MMSSVVGIVVGHGNLAAGLVSAVQAITGRGDELIPLSNEGANPAGVVARIAGALDESGATVVFTDLPAGSCTLAARRLQKDRPALTVVVGVNLPMLLEFVLRDAHGADDIEAAVGRGRDHVRIMPAPNVG
jgi:mannose/fructose-specific phosphotransferase system component IIA